MDEFATIFFMDLLVLVGYKVPVEFKKQQVFIHPYLLGYWLFNQSNDFDVLSIKNAKVFKKLEKIINLIYPKLYLC